jgi:hypothetical protein
MLTTAAVKIKKMDESIVSIPWSNIDTIQGKKTENALVGSQFRLLQSTLFFCI